MNRFRRTLVPGILGLTACILCGCGLQYGEAPGDIEDEGEENSELISDGSPNPKPFPLPGEPLPPLPEQPTPPTPPSTEEPEVFGNWLMDEGAMLPNFIQGLATFGVTIDVAGLTLEKNGVGRVFLRDRLTDANDCVPVLHVFDGETLVLDFSFEVSEFVAPDRTFFFPVVQFDEETLAIADEDGLIAFFTRQQELPDDVTCGELTIDDRFDGLPTPQFFSDLVLFDGDLVYSTATQIERFDLDLLGMGAPLGPVSGRLVQTTQGSHLWTHCGCGGSRDAFRRNLATVFDTVSSELELGGTFTMRALAFDPTTDLLWIHGRTASDSLASFMLVDTSGEPDVALDTMTFNRDLRALAFDGSSMWGIIQVATQSVVQIDMETGRVIQTFQVPDENVTWGGLVFDAFNMYMLGTDEAGQGVIVRSQRTAVGLPPGGTPPGNS